MGRNRVFATDEFRSLPGVTDTVSAAKTSPTAWRNLAEHSYWVVVKRMGKYLKGKGFLHYEEEVDDLFARVWSSQRMRTVLEGIQFTDRWHFINVYCLELKRLVLDDAARKQHGGEVRTGHDEADNRSRPVDEFVELVDLTAKLHEAVRSLPHELRVVVEGHFFDAKTLRQIAAELGLAAPSAVKKRLDKALAQLRLQIPE